MRVPDTGQAAQHMCELFRRMFFNILIDNNDDHDKNHLVQMDDTGCYSLSPVFDVLPTGQALAKDLSTFCAIYRVKLHDILLKGFACSIACNTASFVRV
jgi:serine/threonine protein kinase HipA of HipAB toxin-antitoxin module